MWGIGRKPTKKLSTKRRQIYQNPGIIKEQLKNLKERITLNRAYIIKKTVKSSGNTYKMCVFGKHRTPFKLCSLSLKSSNALMMIILEYMVNKQQKYLNVFLVSSSLLLFFMDSFFLLFSFPDVSSSRDSAGLRYWWILVGFVYSSLLIYCWWHEHQGMLVVDVVQT